MMDFLTPWWAKGLLILVLVGGSVAGADMLYEHVKAIGVTEGKAEVQVKWDADKIARDNAQSAAIAKRLEDNKTDLAAQKADFDVISKGNKNEIATVRNALARSERLRLGAGWCAADSGVTGPNSGPTAGGSNGADPSGGLLRADIDRDIKSLMLKMEEVAATGRAAQEVVRQDRIIPDR